MFPVIGRFRQSKLRSKNVYNKKVLLRECKSNTACCVASPWGVPALARGIPTLVAGELPTLARGVPTLAGGGTYLGQGVSTLARGYLPWPGGSHLGQGYPPWPGWGTSPGVDRQTLVKTVPSHHTMYMCGKNLCLYVKTHIMTYV